MTIGSPRARFSASLRRVTGLRSSRWKRGSRGGEDTNGSFRVGAPALRGRRPLDEDVVDEAGFADTRGDDDEAAGLLERVGVHGGEVLRGDAVLAQDGFARCEAALGRGAEGGAEGGGPGALGRREVDVAARHGEAVWLTDGGEDLDVEWEVEVAAHAPEDRDL